MRRKRGVGIVANWHAGYSDFFFFPREARNLDFISNVLIKKKKHKTTLCVPEGASRLAAAGCHHFVASVL